jgi:subtilisin family serine protease
MKWRPLTWLLLSIACFIAAFYFWRLGDKWQAEKKAEVGGQRSEVRQKGAATQPQAREPVKVASVKSASTAPIVDLNPPATNAVTPPPTNRFPYRLSNTTQSVSQLSRNDEAILLENALIDTSKTMQLPIPDSLHSHGDPGAYLVQANGPITDAFRAQLKAAGASFVAYIPNNAYLVTASASAAQQLARNYTVVPYEPYYKIKASLMKAALAGDAVAAVDVAVFPDALDQTKAALGKLGVTVASESPSPFGTVLTLQNLPNIAAIAGLPGIQEVEPYFQRKLMNDVSRELVGVSTDTVTTTNYLNLTGLNVLVAVADSFSPTTNATQFNPDLTNIIADPNFFPIGFEDTEGHGTHVGGGIAASGANSPTNAVGSVPGANFRGKAPGANLWRFRFKA